MALARRSSQRFNNAIWPGFVDAMTGLLLVLMFVLTIFMVIQFVLRETITGQESQLNDLAAEVATLAEALGIETQRTNDLTNSLTDAQANAAAQAALIAQLTTDRDRALTQLNQAENEITGFEARIAGLLADQADAESTISDLQSRQTELLSEQDALNLALANARSEIDEGVEAARLAAAQREALESMIAELQAAGTADATRISELEAERLSNVARISDLEAAELAQAAAAEALRERLANADTELTAMTLALEEKRREAEETLTLLAATEAARDELTANLTAALLAQQNTESALANATQAEQTLNAQLIAALAAQGVTSGELEAANEALAALELKLIELQTAVEASDADSASLAAELAAAMAEKTNVEADAAEREAALQAQLVEALLAGQQAAETANAAQSDLETRLAEALLARETLQQQIADLSNANEATQLLQDDLRAQLAAALSSSEALQTEKERQTALLAAANLALSQEEALSAESQRQVALLNAQVAELRNQVGSLQELLNIANAADSDANVQIERLGEQLNTALARVAAEERRRAALEEAERLRLEEEAARLQAETQDLERFRSDFFGELRSILEGQDGVQIVGDRFVFSSEVLFQPARAELSPLGQQEIAKVATILSNVADQIPEEIDWIIRVDGHTDNTPLSGFGQFRDNWELSQARALSVVRYMNETLGIPPNRLAANGFGQYQPLNPADTDEARAQNRRIELKLTER